MLDCTEELLPSVHLRGAEPADCQLRSHRSGQQFGLGRRRIQRLRPAVRPGDHSGAGAGLSGCLTARSLRYHPSMSAMLPRLPKPAFNQPCNGCGYCCTVEPCQLAQEFLRCDTGPCVALEAYEGRTICGLVRNPLAYLFWAVHPETHSPALTEAPEHPEGHALSAELAQALGVGRGCDSEDDEESREWSLRATWEQLLRR